MTPRIAPPLIGFRQLLGYQRAWLRFDVLAGITVTAYLVPQCLAYAGLANVPPVAGLWVAVMAMLAYAILGTSRHLSVGPESTTAIMVAAAVAPVAAGDPERHIVLSGLLAILVGVACLVAFLIRFGFLADLLSQPILVGFMAGVALVMIGSQVGTIAGVSLSGEGAIDRIIELGGRLDEVRPAAVVLSAIVLAVLLVVRRLAPLAPGTLIVVVGSVLAVLALGLEARGLPLVGAIPAGVPRLALPVVSVADVAALAGPAVAIAVVAFSDIVLTGRAFAIRHRYAVDANREFLALGAANVAAGFTGGFALSSSGSRTAIIDAVGGKTQLVGIVAALSVTLVVLLLPGAIALIPKATLGGIVVFAALRLIDAPGLLRLGRFRTTEAGLAITAAAGVVLFDVLAGILVAVALSVVDLFARIARPPASLLGRVPGLAGLHNVDDYPTAERIPGLVVFRYDAPLCFANASDFRLRALAFIDAETEPVRWFLLNAEAIVELDLTAADAVRDLHDELTARGITFAMARVKQDLRAQLDRGGLLEVIGPERLYPTLPVALEAYEAHRQLASGAAAVAGRSVP